MLPKCSRYVFYAVLLMISMGSTSVFAKNNSPKILSELSYYPNLEIVAADTLANGLKSHETPSSRKSKNSATKTVYFTTIIQGADEEVECTEDGSTVARFTLCGDSDNRIISLSGGPYGTVSWERVTGGCTPDVNAPCPLASCSYSQIGSGETLTIDASSIPVSTGAEFRVRTSSAAPYYYFEVAKSTVTQSFVKKDVECGSPGRIQITGLSSAYEYSIDSGSGFGAWQDATFEGLTPGTYNVKTRLKNTPGACEYPYEPIEIEQKDITIEATLVDASCAGDTGSITVNVNNTVSGPYKYTLLDENGTAQEFTAFIPEDNYTFAAVGFGTYMVQVETQQCTGDPLNGIDSPRQDRDTNGDLLVIGDGVVPLAASTDVNSSFGCSTITSVDVTVHTSGGSPPYTYIVNGAGSSSLPYTDSSTYSVNRAGTYDFLITDSNGCTIAASSNVEELSPPEVNVSGVDGTCTNGGARINFEVVDAKGYNLSYRVNTVDPWVTTTSIPVPATENGTTYTRIVVRYQQGSFECTLDLPNVTLTNVSDITGFARKISDRACDGSGNIIGGQIDFGASSGGSGSGYTYSLDGVNFTSTRSFTDLISGTYTPIIEDGGGCRLELSEITILDVDPPTDIDFITSNSNCNTGTVDLQLMTTSNAAITKYAIISPMSVDNGASDTFVGLSISQSYLFEITDENNCTYTEGYSPAIETGIRTRVKSGGETRNCSGLSNGSGTFLVDGFSSNYTYSINGGAESAPQNASEVSLSGLAAGTYTIVATDVDRGCTDSASFTVEEPATPLSVTGNVTAMSCANGNSGRLDAQSTGGWGNTKYTLVYPGGGTTVGPKTGSVFNGLTTGGTYTLTATDVEGCTSTFTFDLTPILSPVLSLNNAASDFCYMPGTGATVVVSSSAGTAAVASHQYRINGGTLQASPTFAGLSPGNYTIEIVDGNGCSDTLEVTIRPQLRVRVTIESEIPCGGADGQIQIQASSGYLSNTTPKTYEVSSDNGLTFTAAMPFTSNTFLYDTNVAGDYVFRISDNQGCIAESEPVKLDPPQTISAATATVVPASCGQTDNGIVTIIPDATSGVPGYEISFNGGAFGTQATFSNLVAGDTYTYIVRDSRGCETTVASVTIPQNNTLPPDATVTSNLATCTTGPLAGSIDVTGVTDGTSEFTFILQDEFGVEIERVGPTASTTTSFDDLPPGNYEIVTIDALGCRDTDIIAVEQTIIDVVPDPVVPLCNVLGFSNTVEIFGGIGPFLIRLENVGTPEAVNLPPRRHTFSNLELGVAYTVEVTDQATGCVFLDEIPPIDGPTTLEISATTTAGYCDLNRFGQIIYDVDGFDAGSDLIIEVLNDEDGSRTTIESPMDVSPVYSGTYEALPGNYQIIVTNLSDNCKNATQVTITQNLPSIDILSTNPANCEALGSITVQGNSGGGGPYEFAFMPLGGTPGNGDFNASTTFFGPAGNYDVYVKDATGCTSFANAEIIPIEPPLPVPTFVVENQCAVASPSFDIKVSVPSSVDTPRFVFEGDSQFPVDNGTEWEYTFVVHRPGSYLFNIIDANGCTSEGTAVVYEFLSASGGFSTMPTCNDADGEITIISNGGSGDFDYELTGTNYLGATIGPITQSDNNIFTSVQPGSYQVLVMDRSVSDGTSNCTFLVDDINLDQATPPVILPNIPHNISCNATNDGSIDIEMQAGTDVDSPLTFRLMNSGTNTVLMTNTTGSFTDLLPGSYRVEVTTDRNCMAISEVLLVSEPDVFAISADASDFSCESGANRFSSSMVTANITSGGTPSNYRYSITGFENYQTNNSFEIIDNGTIQNITIYAIDNNGCRAEASVSINPPSNITASIVENDALNCRDSERVRIQVSGTSDFTVSTTSVTTIAPVTNTAGADYVDIFLPSEGDYFFEIQDNSPDGCAYPMPLHTVEVPQLPTVVISEAKPVGCFGGADGELFITVNDYVGLYTYEVFSGSDPTKTTVLASGTLDTNNNPERIRGLSGGNFFVHITADLTPFCDADSNIANIRSPNGPLTVTAIEIGNVSCTNITGIIEASGNGGWDNAPYEYSLLKDNGSGYVETVAYGVDSEFQNLSGGDYRVAIKDVEGCVNTYDINLPLVPQIESGIREPQELQCPNGNNAILEAYDPSTGDESTATAGATGGFPGAGYTYRLLYLNSGDNTDIASTSGLQNSPTFVGLTGGFISGGWYAIEVTSSYDCAFVTEPYFVDPPPPIKPRLVMTKVPGCGGLGQMQLSVEDPDHLFSYEYVGFENNVQIGDYVDMPSSASILITGESGTLYQYDVRKKNASNTCSSVRSNGIRMTDASDISLITNSPIDPISCYTEVDGRIESFSNGGVGDQMFTLYIGNPIDGFNSGSATVYREAQPEGTFEGLPAGTDYWIGVTSGISCEAIDGPFEVKRPDPIIFTADVTPVTCNGETDGTITVEVTSGGVGLIQFALSPDFNRFFSDSSTPGKYTFDALAAGSYEVLILDENGCPKRTVLTINEPEVLQADLSVSTTETCLGFENGTATLVVTGGTPFVDPLTSVAYYETKLIGSNPDGSEIFERNDTLFFDNLIGGETYIVEIQDAQGCLDDVVITIPIGVDISVETSVQYGCEGIFPFNTATVTMVNQRLMSSLLFALDPDDPTDAITANADTETVWGDLPAGEHIVYIYHPNGCVNSVTFVTENYDPLEVSIEKTAPNEITAFATGGFGEYEFFFQGVSSGSENVFTTNVSTTITIEVRDQGGCVVLETIPFEFTGVLVIPNYFTPDGDNENDEWAPKNREYFPNIEVIIYDRYGRVVKVLDQIDKWDGDYGETGEPLPSGDYWYEVNANDKFELHYIGHFTLFR